MATKKPISDTFTWHELVAAFGLKADFLDLPGSDDETYSNAYREAKDYALTVEGFGEDTAEEFAMEAAQKAEQKAVDLADSAYFNSAVEAIETAAGWFDLDVETRHRKGKETLYKVRPKTSWKHSMGEILETINGVGYFWFDSVKEFLEHGPYTARQAVLGNLGYAKDYGDVYGVASLQRIFEKNLDYR